MRLSCSPQLQLTAPSSSTAWVGTSSRPVTSGLVPTAEVLEAEGWMTGEDAIEVACWHLQSTDTCNLAHGESSRTAPHGKTPLEPKPEAPRRSTHGKRPRTGTALARLAGGERRFQPWNAMAESQGREARAGVQQESRRALV